jgi:Cu/Ag efflux pump CusA
VQARLAAMTFPLEYHAEVLTDSTSGEIGATKVIATAIAVLVAMFLLLQAALRSWRVAALAFLTLPAALAGGLLVVLFDGATLSLGALLGLLGTLAIAVRGAILIVSRIHQLEDDGKLEPGSELVQHGAREQFGAIAPAALATAAFLVPFAVLGSSVGLEIVHPMATVLLGGLVTATLMNLFALPALYVRFAARTQRDPADGLLYRWAGAEAAPPPAAATVTATATAEGS